MGGGGSERSLGVSSDHSKEDEAPMVQERGRCIESATLGMIGQLESYNKNSIRECGRAASEVAECSCTHGLLLAQAWRLIMRVR